jgi:hypothetical protein
MTEEGHRITADFIVEALADQYGVEKSAASKRISIKNFDVTDGSKKGDNFACVMKVLLVAQMTKMFIQNSLILVFCM